MSNILLKPYVLDNGLAALASGATHVYICSTVPTTYTEATSTYAIGSKSLGAGNVFGAPQAATPNGRKIISAAVSGGTVTGTAVTPVCFAVVDSVNTRL